VPKGARPAYRAGKLAAIGRAVGRHIMTGLTLMGQANMFYVPPVPLARPDGPPLRHPERLAPSSAPSAVELALWAQLNRYDDEPAPASARRRAYR
jgi:Family of unknown function (DUF6059)